MRFRESGGGKQQIVRFRAGGFVRGSDSLDHEAESWLVSPDAVRRRRSARLFNGQYRLHPHPLVIAQESQALPTLVCPWPTKP
jgi:hypothetical protein